MIEANVIGAEWRGWYMPARTVDSYFNILHGLIFETSI